MMIGNRQRHHYLAIGLLAKLPAILMLHADRVDALLGVRRVIDNPGLDRPMTLDRRHHHLAHLGQHPLVRPRCVGNEMQQLLMLRRDPGRRRYRRHRLYALATLRRQKPHAIISQRHRPIRVPDHARQTLDIPGKPRFTVLRNLATHISLRPLKRESHQVTDSDRDYLRPSDSVRVGLVIRFLSIRPRLCSTLLSGPTSRWAPLARS